MEIIYWRINSFCGVEKRKALNCPFFVFSFFKKKNRFIRIAFQFNSKQYLIYQ